MDFLPSKREIIGPEEGWEAQTYYLVKVAYSSGNPIHHCFFYSGFVREGKPSGYNQVWHPSSEGLNKLSDVYYMKVVKKIGKEGNSEIILYD